MSLFIEKRPQIMKIQFFKNQISLEHESEKIKNKIKIKADIDLWNVNFSRCMRASYFIKVCEPQILSKPNKDAIYIYIIFKLERNAFVDYGVQFLASIIEINIKCYFLFREGTLIRNKLNEKNLISVYCSKNAYSHNEKKKKHPTKNYLSS